MHVEEQLHSSRRQPEQITSILFRSFHIIRVSQAGMSLLVETVTYFRRFQRVVTRLAGWVRAVSKCRGSGRVIMFYILTLTGRGSAQDVLKSRESGRVGSGREVSKSDGSCRVGLRGLKVSRVGRVGSRSLEIVRVGSGHDPRTTGHSRVKATVTRGLFLADPRVEPADLAVGYAFFSVAGACRRTIVEPAPHGSDPRVRN